MKASGRLVACLGVMLGVMVMSISVTPARADEAPAGSNSPWTDNYHLTLPKLAAVMVGVLAGGSLFYFVAEQIFVDTVVDTSAGVAQTVVNSDITEHSGIVAALTIFGGTITGILSGLGYDRYHSEVEQFANDLMWGAQQIVAALGRLTLWSADGGAGVR